MPGNSLRLHPKHADAFRAIQSYLIKKRAAFYTFALPEEEGVKLALEGILSSTSCDLIRKELPTLGYLPTSVSLLKTVKRLINSFLIKLRKIGTFNTIYDLSLFMYLGAQVRFLDPRPGPSRCFNYHRFGHSSVFCHQPP